MANEKQIIQDVNNAVEQLTGTFEALQKVIDGNLEQQEKLINYINELKKSIGASKELKDFINLSSELTKTQDKLNKTQQSGLKVAVEHEKVKQQEAKTAKAATDALIKEEQKKRAMIQTEEAQERQKKRLLAEQQKAERASRDAQSAYKRESERLRELTQRAKDAAVQYGINSKEVRALRNEQQALDKTIKQIDGSLGIHNRSVGNYQKAIGGVTNVLGAFGLALGGAEIAQRLFTGVIKSSQTAGDAWAVTVAGMQGGLESFYRTLGTGDWSNFFKNIREGIRLSRELEKAMDDQLEARMGQELRLTEIEREMAETQSRMYEHRATKNKAAFLDEFEIFEGLSKEKLRITADENDRIFRDFQKAHEGRMKISQEEFESFLKNFREEEGLRSDAEMYNQQLANHERYLRGVRSAHRENSAQVQNAKKNMEDFIAATDIRVREYADLLSRWGATNEEENQRLVNARMAIIRVETEHINEMRRMNALRAQYEQEFAEKQDDNAKKTIENYNWLEEREEDYAEGVEKWMFTATKLASDYNEYQRKLAAETTKALEDQLKERVENEIMHKERMIALEKEINQKSKEFAITSINAIFERKDEKYSRDLEANRKYFDGLLANEKLDQEQRSLLEAQREQRENQIREAQKENERKQFLFNQAVKVSEVIMEMMKGIAAANAMAAVTMGASLLWIPKIKMSAGLSIATIMAQSIPQFDKGSDYTPETFIAGEKRPEFLIDRRGDVSLVDKPTLFSGKEYKGGRVISGTDTAKIFEAIRNYTTTNIITNGANIEKQDLTVAKRIDALMDKYDVGIDRIVAAVKKRPKGRNSQIDIMRTNALKNKLKS